MSSMKNDLVDKRIVERNITKGLISKQDHEDYLSKLEDLDGRFELVDASPETTPDAPETPGTPETPETLATPETPEPTLY